MKMKLSTLSPNLRKAIFIPREPKVFKKGKKKPEKHSDSTKFSSWAPILSRHASSTRKQTFAGHL